MRGVSLTHSYSHTGTNPRARCLQTVNLCFPRDLAGNQLSGSIKPWQSWQPVERVSYYVNQTHYSRIGRGGVYNTFHKPIITSIIDVKKITACGESGFPAGFLVPVRGVNCCSRREADCKGRR